MRRHFGSKLGGSTSALFSQGPMGSPFIKHVWNTAKNHEKTLRSQTWRINVCPFQPGTRGVAVIKHLRNTAKKTMGRHFGDKLGGSTSVLFSKGPVGSPLSKHLRNTAKKTMGRHFGDKLGGSTSALFSQGPMGSPLSNIFTLESLRLHLDEILHYKCDISSSKSLKILPANWNTDDKACRCSSAWPPASSWRRPPTRCSKSEPPYLRGPSATRWRNHTCSKG